MLHIAVLIEIHPTLHFVTAKSSPKIMIGKISAKIFVIQSAKEYFKMQHYCSAISYAFQDESRLIMGITYCNICFAAAINIVAKRHVPWKKCIN